MEQINPKKDGIDHINIYSRGCTELGRWMSNFAHTPIKLKDGNFASIEGYWYWLKTKDDRLRNLYGFQAKKLGKSLLVKCIDEEFCSKIEQAILEKTKNYPEMVDKLKKCNLPLKHYYVFNNTAFDAGYKWVIEIWERIRGDLKNAS